MEQAFLQDGTQAGTKSESARSLLTCRRKRNVRTWQIIQLSGGVKGHLSCKINKLVA